MSDDVVRQSALAGRMVFWEESARDGAQAKTLMAPEFRVRLAQAQGRMFGDGGPRQVVFAAGFPAVCREEFEAVRRVAAETEGVVSVAAVCRAAKEDLLQAVASVEGNSCARVMVVVPASEPMAQVMVHQSARDALEFGTDLVRRARDLNDRVAVDLCFADASRADVGLMAEYAELMTRAGAGAIILADTVGRQLPQDSCEMFTKLRARTSSEVVLGSHLHNDLGLGLANTLEAVTAGVRVVSSSWLGIAERAGMVATEQLILLLATRSADLLGEDGQPWWHGVPDLRALPSITRSVSAETGVPLSVTTPIVGTGVGTISTGTPFVDRDLFQPFDPEELLGVTPEIVLTQLASARVVTAAAAEMGYRITRAEAKAATLWVKQRAYATSCAVVDNTAFTGYLDGLTSASA